LSEDELGWIWRACEDDDHGRIARLLILTGSRREEIGGLKSSEIDRERRQILLPAERCKNGREHLIPLTDEALGLLPERPGFIFGRLPSAPFGGWSRSKTKLDADITQARARAGLESMAPWRLHDIRRSFVTHISERGFAAPHVCEALINHISGHKGGVAGVYNRASYLSERRQALDKWSAHIRNLIAGV
jgi:integrase